MSTRIGFWVRCVVVCVDAVSGLGREGRGLGLGGVAWCVGGFHCVMGVWHCGIRVRFVCCTKSASVLLG